MKFEWDSAKREKVVQERGIDFLVLAAALFDGRPTLTLPSKRFDEERFISVGLVDGVFYMLVWMRREPSIRLITARRARDGEARQYRTLYT